MRTIGWKENCVWVCVFSTKLLNVKGKFVSYERQIQQHEIIMSADL